MIIDIFLAIVFALLSVGVGVFVVNRKAYSFSNIDLSSSKLKVGAICLVLINLYSLIDQTIYLFSSYTSNENVYYVENPVAMKFSSIFSLAIFLLYISIGICLLLKQLNIAFVSSVSALTFTIFKNLFLDSNKLLLSYVTFLPSIAVLLSMIVIFTAANGKTKLFYNYSKLLKVAPYLILTRLLYTILIAYPDFNSSVIISLVSVVLNFLAFLLIFNSLTSVVPPQSTDTCEVNVNKKEKVLVTLTLLISPSIVSLVSSIDKTWLFAGGVVLALLLPITLAHVTTKKAKIIVLIVTLVIVVAVCMFAKFIISLDENSNKTEPCGICGGDGVVTQKLLGDGSGVQNGFDTYYRCKGCHGTGTK